LETVGNFLEMTARSNALELVAKIGLNFGAF